MQILLTSLSDHVQQGGKICLQISYEFSYTNPETVFGSFQLKYSYRHELLAYDILFLNYSSYFNIILITHIFCANTFNNCRGWFFSLKIRSSDPKRPKCVNICRNKSGKLALGTILYVIGVINNWDVTERSWERINYYYDLKGCLWSVKVIRFPLSNGEQWPNVIFRNWIVVYEGY